MELLVACFTAANCGKVSQKTKVFRCMQILNHHYCIYLEKIVSTVHVYDHGNICAEMQNIQHDQTVGLAHHCCIKRWE